MVQAIRSDARPQTLEYDTLVQCGISKRTTLRSRKIKLPFITDNPFLTQKLSKHVRMGPLLSHLIEFLEGGHSGTHHCRIRTLSVLRI
jgi:hypothetical protein